MSTLTKIVAGQIWKSNRYNYEYQITMVQHQTVYTKSLHSGLKVSFPRSLFEANFTLVDTGDFKV